MGVDAPDGLLKGDLGAPMVVFCGLGPVESYQIGRQAARAEIGARQASALRRQQLRSPERDPCGPDETGVFQGLPVLEGLV
jgi:hypothetical protein